MHRAVIDPDQPENTWGCAATRSNGSLPFAALTASFFYEAPDVYQLKVTLFCLSGRVDYFPFFALCATSDLSF